jgi:hypothetical protein
MRAIVDIAKISLSPPHQLSKEIPAMKFVRVLVILGLFLCVVCTMRWNDGKEAARAVRDPRFPARQITGPSADEVIEKLSRKLKVRVEDQANPGTE